MTPRGLRVTVLGAALAAAAVAGQRTPARRAASRRDHHVQRGTSSASTGVKPSIVLVHGAWGDSSSWDGVVTRLQADGYTVYVPPNPCSGLTYDSASIRDFLDTISGPIILVGHSYGGAVITNAATGDKQRQGPGLRGRVRARTRARPSGSSSLPVPGTCVCRRQPISLVPYPGAPKGAVDAYIKQSVFPGCMANGLPASEAKQLAATQRPLTTLALTQPSGVPAWKTIPSWAVVGTADHAIPPAELLAMAQRPHAHITEVKGPAPVDDQRPRASSPA